MDWIDMTKLLVFVAGFAGIVLVFCFLMEKL